MGMTVPISLVRLDSFAGADGQAAYFFWVWVTPSGSAEDVADGAQDVGLASPLAAVLVRASV